MTKKEIEKGAGLLLAAVSGCEQMVELLRAAVITAMSRKRQQKISRPRAMPDLPGFTISGQRAYRMFPSCLWAARFRIETWQEEP